MESQLPAKCIAERALQTAHILVEDRVTHVLLGQALHRALAWRPTMTKWISITTSYRRPCRTPQKAVYGLILEPHKVVLAAFKNAPVLWGYAEP